MPSPSELKTAIDSQITDKTDPYSIDNNDVGNRMKDIVDLTIPLQFETTNLRIAYLTNPNRQPFQLADDKEDGFKYYLNKTSTAWVKLASDNTPVTEVIIFNNQATLVLDWNAERQSKFGASGTFTVETLDEDGKYRIKTGIEIYPDDIITTTQYHFDFGGGLRSGRITIK